jgi:hypothetical protein
LTAESIVNKRTKGQSIPNHAPHRDNSRDKLHPRDFGFLFPRAFHSDIQLKLVVVRFPPSIGSVRRRQSE